MLFVTFNNSKIQYYTLPRFNQMLNLNEIKFRVQSKLAANS